MQLIPTLRVPPAPRRALRPAAAPARARAAGFTLIEILVTVAIVSVGLLGLAKLQAAAISETQTSRVRSVMTMQAESLANAMRSDRTFWASTTTTMPSFTIAAGGAVTYGTAFPTAHSGGCTSPSSACSPGEVARDDVGFWATGFGSQFPTATGSMSCSATTGPVTCDLTLTWTENIIAINRSSGAASGSGAASSNTNYLVIHIEP